MKWERATIVARIVCLLFGVGGIGAVWLLIPANAAAAEPVSPVYIVLAALGALQFLVIGIFGRYPSFVPPQSGGKQ